MELCAVIIKMKNNLENRLINSGYSKVLKIILLKAQVQKYNIKIMSYSTFNKFTNIKVYCLYQWSQTLNRNICSFICAYILLQIDKTADTFVLIRNNINKNVLKYKRSRLGNTETFLRK